MKETLTLEQATKIFNNLYGLYAEQEGLEIEVRVTKKEVSDAVQD